LLSEAKELAISIVRRYLTKLKFRSDQERNFFLLYVEAFLMPFTGIAGAFAGAYAVRLGATNTEIGLMNSIPSLLVILVSIPFGRMLQTSGRKMFWILGGISLYRIGYMLFARAPMMGGSLFSPGVIFISMFALVAVPIQFYNIGTVGVMIDVVPEERRAAVFTTRNAISSIINIAGVFLAGQWLGRMVFPGNYQILFLVSGFMALLSLFAWLGLRYTSSGGGTRPDSTAQLHQLSLANQLKELSHVFRGHPMFSRFMVNTLLLNTGMWLVGPLYVLYTVRQLGASDAWIGTAGTVASLASLIGLLVGRRLIEWWGALVTQRRLVLFMGIYPVMVGLAPSLTLILVIGGLYNLLTPGFSLSNYNVWLKVVPAAQREDATAIFNTVMSIGPFIFPLIGVSLAEHFGISPVLIGSGLLAFLGSISFWVWKIRIEPE
jgi:MFS family permease